MDEGKILVVNLSKGLIGEDNAGILGAFLVTKVQLAAMSRSDIPDVKDRRPFYLYVDEFQNFATDSFAVILSEARKYGLNLTVANQYIAQMTDSVRDAVFGNVGTTISFRVSADDAPLLVKQFEPTFDGSDLIQMSNRHFIISMIINGEKVPAFSATTLSIPQPPADHFDEIIASSREQYSRPRSVVEEEIRETIEASEKYKKELSDSGRAAGEQGTTRGDFSGATFQFSKPEANKPHYDFDSSKITESKSFKPGAAQEKSNQTVHKTSYEDNRAKPHNNNRKQNKNRTKHNGKNKPQTPQEAFRNLKLSPNTAEEKDRPGLKDLGRLIEERESENHRDRE